jgi:HK97 family phage prohead protease
MPPSLIPPGTREIRVFKVDRIEVRKAADSGLRTLVGHAAVFNSDSEPMYGFIERIRPGCFTRAIKEDDVRGLFNHDANFVLGRNKAKTLRLSEDDKGLAFEIDLPDTQAARDLVILIERGDISGCSFSFRTIKDEWEYSETNGNGITMRTLVDVELFDVGPVTFPAYPATDVSARSMEAIAAEGQRIIAARKKPDVSIESRRRQLELAEAE